MIIYQCSFCKYITDKPSNFEKHINKKNNCVSRPSSKKEPECRHKYSKTENEFQCLGCNKKFKHYSSLNRHVLHRCSS